MADEGDTAAPKTEPKTDLAEAIKGFTDQLGDLAIVVRRVDDTVGQVVPRFERLEKAFYGKEVPPIDPKPPAVVVNANASTLNGTIPPLALPKSLPPIVSRMTSAEKGLVSLHTDFEAMSKMVAKLAASKGIAPITADNPEPSLGDKALAFARSGEARKLALATATFLLLLWGALHGTPAPAPTPAPPSAPIAPSAETR